MALIKRSELLVFLNTTPGENAETWGLAGKKTTDSSWSYEADETSETYVTDDVATNTVNSYALTMDDEMKCNSGDAVFEFVNDIRYYLKTNDEAVTDVLLIDKYDVVEEGKFRAQQFKCSIVISNYGGPGGQTATLTYAIKCSGNPKFGTVTMSNGVPTFTEVASA